jgi:hypothetical protein
MPTFVASFQSIHKRNNSYNIEGCSLRSLIGEDVMHTAVLGIVRRGTDIERNLLPCIAPRFQNHWLSGPSIERSRSALSVSRGSSRLWPGRLTQQVQQLLIIIEHLQWSMESITFPWSIVKLIRNTGRCSLSARFIPLIFCGNSIVRDYPRRTEKLDGAPAL